MKKILFSPHLNFLRMIKQHFSDKEKYLILGIQEHFIKSLQDVDIENVETFIGNDVLQSQAYDYAAQIIKQKKKLPSKYKDNDVFQEFLDKLDSLAYRRLYELIIFLLLLDEKKPDIVVLHNDVEPFMRLIALWARANNVPCLQVPHSIIIDSSEKSPVGSDIHDIIISSDVVVGGDYQKDWYVQRGLQEDNIYQTGLPQFDEISVEQHDRDRAVRLLRLDVNEPVVTYASSWRQDTNLLGCHDGVEQTYINFLKASKKLGIRPIVKIHPNSSQNSIDWHTMTAKKIGIYAILVARHLHTVLQASNLLFSFGPSNILLEGSFFPMHLVVTHGYDDDDVVTKVGEEATDDEIAETISGLLGSPADDPLQFRHKYIGVADGKAGNRVAKVIEEL